MEVTEQQARFFVLLSKAGAWDIKRGSIEIHIDAFGNPLTADTHQHTELPKLSPTVDVDRITVVI